MTVRVIFFLFVVMLLLLDYSNASCQSSSASTTVTFNIESQAADQHGQIMLEATDREANTPRLIAPLPEGFLTLEIKDISLIEPTMSGRSLPAERVWLRGLDSRLYPMADMPLTQFHELVEVEYQLDWRDLPGTYHGKLLARGARRMHALDIMITVPPFVEFEVRSERVGFSADGQPTGRIEIAVNSNARNWSLAYRLETPEGKAACNDLKLIAERALGFLDVTSRGHHGVINGRGATQERLLVLIPQGVAGSGACDAVVVIEEVTAR